MNKKPYKQCEGCPFEDRVLVKSEIHPNPQLVFVAECPAVEEVKQNRILIGKTGQFFRETLKRLGVERAYLTNAVLCYNNGDSTYPKEVIKRCGERLKEELSSIPNNIPIVLMGNIALRAYANMSNIMETRGFVYDINNKKVFCTVHPTAVLRKPSLLPLFESDIKKSLRPIEYEKPNLHVIQTIEELVQLADLLTKSNSFAFDLETSDLDPYTGEILCFSFAPNSYDGYVVPWMKNGQYPHFNFNEALPYIKQIFESPVPKIGQNAYSFDLKFLRKMHIHTENYYFDTLIAHHLIDENLPHDLNSLITYYTSLPRYDLELLSHLPNKATSYAVVPSKILWKYAGYDAVATYQIYLRLEEELRKEGVYELFREVSMPLSLVLHEIEWTGVLVSKSKALEFQKRIEHEILELETSIYEIVGEEFNINSVKQLRDVLFGKLKLTTTKRTAKNAYSTSSEALSEIDHPIAKHLLRWRELNKIKTTYLGSGSKGLLSKLGPDGRVHPSYLITGTHTGRISTKNPGIHQIPRNFVRSIFISAPGYSIVESDYKSGELVMVAYYSQCKALIEKFQAGEDVLKWVASLVFGKDVEDVTKQERTYAKFALYGICYGRGPSSLASQFSISFEKAKSIIDSIFRHFPELRVYQNAAIRLARTKGVLTNVYGRKRRLGTYDTFYPEFDRQAINFYPQSTLADTAHCAIIDIHKGIKRLGLDAKIIVYIHDGIIAEVRDDQIDAYITLATDCMERLVPKLNCRLQVEHEVGKWWKPKE